MPRPALPPETDAPGEAVEPPRATPPTELVVAATGAVALGVVLRFLAPTPLWLDEALSVSIADLPVGDLLEALRHDGHPPLYYLLLRGWTTLVGTGDAAVRALSGLLSVATLPLVYVAGRRRGGHVLGLLALAVLALSPYALRYATETRMYALVMLEVLVGWLLVDDLLAGRSSRWRAPALALTAGALLLTHYWSVFLLGATALAVLAWARGAVAERRGPTVAVLAALAGGGLLFLPWLGSFLYQAQHTGTPWAPPMRPTAVVGATLQDVAGGDLHDAVLGVALLGALVVLGVAGRPIDRRRIELDLATQPTVRREAVVTATTLALGSLAALATGAAYATRYAAVVVPLLVLVVAAGLACFAEPAWRLAALLAVLGFGLVGTAWQLTSERTQAGVVADAAHRALGGRPGGDGAVVVYCPDQLGPAGARAMAQRWTADGTPPRQVVYPTFDGPERVDWVDYAERNEAADPTAFTARLLDEVPPDAPVLLVWNPTYRTFEGRCEAVRDGLAAARPDVEDLVRMDGDEFYEHATLTIFRPVGR